MLFTSKSLLSETDVTVVMPTKSLQQTAQRFAQRHPSFAERIYRNTLAVGVVDQYLSLLGIKTDLAEGDSWNPVMQMVNDVADLYLPDYGRIECRVVDTDTTECYVPADVSCDRIAYIVINLKLTSDKPEAALLGFVTEVTDEWIQLDSLLSLSELPQYLSDSSMLKQTDKDLLD
ncbi:MAG: DUF1822 family protein [Cyanobacteria bacterium P01_C01_bin.118]